MIEFGYQLEYVYRWFPIKCQLTKTIIVVLVKAWVQQLLTPTLQAQYHVFVTGPAFADELLQAARSLYKFARSNRGLYSDCVDGVENFYK